MTEQKGISTRAMLVSAMVLVIASVTSASLLVIRDRMQRQVLRDFSQDLAHSVETFQSFESQRLAALERENALLADQVGLKALMTTSDARTIEDGGVEFWKVSDDDLFALASPEGEIVAAYTRGTPADAQLRSDLAHVLSQTGTHYLLSSARLFEYSVRPLYFGGQASGTLLGFVIGGEAIDTAFLRQVNRSSAAEIAFLAGDRVVTSTLQPSLPNDPASYSALFAAKTSGAATISLHGERYLTTADDLSSSASAPLRLVVMKSFEHAERSQHEINRLLVLVGFFALVAGTGLMLALSAVVTGPLELLARSVRAFGTGDFTATLPQGGTREVRGLSLAFAAMRDEIQLTNRALLESERLATIGRMASSVSHDLRHYLAAVYANAEFLSSSTLSAEERAELFADIRMAVLGTTELIDSLLVFSRSNGEAQRSPELIALLLERSIAIVRGHPDAEHVHLRAVYDDPAATLALVDAKQMERALYNLLLNACQASRGSVGELTVTASIGVTSDTLSITVTDVGAGVSDAVRHSLFDPFVSAGKQNGTGLGLTLAQHIAEEHGGSVRLVSSCPGETVFVFTIERGAINPDNPAYERPAEVSR